MPLIINLPDGSQAEFADDTKRDEIAQILGDLYPKEGVRYYPIPAQGVALEMPLGATDEEARQIAEGIYPRTAQDVMWDMAADEKFYKKLSVRDYELHREYTAKHKKRLSEAFSEALGMWWEEGVTGLAGGVLDAYKQTLTGEDPLAVPRLAGSALTGLAVGTHDLIDVGTRIISEGQEAPDTYQEFLREEGLKESDEARARYEKLLAEDLKNFQDQLYRFYESEGYIKDSAHPDVARGLRWWLDPSLPAGGLLAKPAVKLAATVGKGTGKALEATGRGTAAVGRVAKELLEEAGETSAKATGVAPGTAATAVGTVAPGTSTTLSGVGTVLSKAPRVMEAGGRVLEEVGIGMQRGIGREGLFGAAATRLADAGLEGTAEYSLARALAYLDTPLSYGAHAAAGAGIGMGVGGGLGYLAAGYEGLGHGLGAGFGMGAFGGVLGRGISGVTRMHWREGLRTDIEAMARTMPEEYRENFLRMTDALGDRAATLIDVMNHYPNTRWHLLSNEQAFHVEFHDLRIKREADLGRELTPVEMEALAREVQAYEGKTPVEVGPDGVVDIVLNVDKTKFDDAGNPLSLAASEELFHRIMTGVEFRQSVAETKSALGGLEGHPEGMIGFLNEVREYGEAYASLMAGKVDSDGVTFTVTEVGPGKFSVKSEFATKTSETTATYEVATAEEAVALHRKRVLKEKGSVLADNQASLEAAKAKDPTHEMIPELESEVRALQADVDALHASEASKSEFHANLEKAFVRDADGNWKINDHKAFDKVYEEFLAGYFREFTHGKSPDFLLKSKRPTLLGGVLQWAKNRLLDRRQAALNKAGVKFNFEEGGLRGGFYGKDGKRIKVPVFDKMLTNLLNTRKSGKVEKFEGAPKEVAKIKDLNPETAEAYLAGHRADHLLAKDEEGKVKVDAKGKVVPAKASEVDAAEKVFSDKVLKVLSETAGETGAIIHPEEGGQTRITMTPDALAAILNSPDLDDGFKMRINQIVTSMLGGGDLFNMTYWSATKSRSKVPSRRVYSALGLSDRKVLFYDLAINQEGGVYARGLDWSVVEKRVFNLWTRETVRNEFGNDIVNFWNEFGKYLDNITSAERRPSAELFGEKKRDIFHNAVGARTSPDKRLNPIVFDEVKNQKEAMNPVKSFRIERMSRLDPTGDMIAFSTDSYRHTQVNYMPARPDAVPDKLSVEVIPGKASGYLDALIGAPLPVRNQFHTDMMQAHINPETGALHILEELGIQHEFSTHDSAYINSAGQLELNPTMMISLGKGTTRAQAQVAANLFGLYGHQEAVGGYQPAYRRGTRSNALRIDIGRLLTEKDIDAIYKALDADQPGASQDVALFPKETGADIVHLGFNEAVAFGKLQKTLGTVLNSKEFAGSRLGEFRAGETIYEFNNWKEQRNGEGYKEAALLHAGEVRGVRRDIFRRVDDRIGDAIGQVYQNWEAAGYGQAPREGRRHGNTVLQPVTQKSKNGYDVPVLRFNNATHTGVAKPKDSSAWGPTQWKDYLAREKAADAEQATLPDKGMSPEEWAAQLETRLDGVSMTELPPHPQKVTEWVRDPKALADHIADAYRRDPELVTKSIEGLTAVRQMHQLAREGGLPVEAVALNYFWGFLSRMLDPYNQEAGWVRMVNNPKFMDALYKSIDGEFAMPRGEYWTPEKVVQSEGWNPKKLSKKREQMAIEMADRRNREQHGTWVELVYRVTRGQQKLNPESAGMNAVQNINGFHQMLANWNGRWNDVLAILNNGELTGPQMREAMWSQGLLGGGVHDKVNSFVILTLAREDVLILDRWQMINFWEPHIKAAVEAKEGAGAPLYTYKNQTVPVEKTGWSDTVQKQLSGMAGSHALYRVLENALGYAAREMDPHLPPELQGKFNSVSALHWVTWNIAKNEAVGHSSLAAVNRFALENGFPNTPKKRKEFIKRFTQAQKYTEEPMPKGGFKRFEIVKGRPTETHRFMPASDLDSLGMFSAAERAAANLKQERGSASQMLAMLKKGGVRDEEIRALGLDEFLKGDRRVSRDEIIDHLVENQITVEETVLNRGGYDLTLDGNKLGEFPTVEAADAHMKKHVDSILGESATVNDYADAFARYEIEGSDAATKHSEYVEPGAIEGSYRELLLRLPEAPAPGLSLKEYYESVLVPERDAAGKPVLHRSWEDARGDNHMHAWVLEKHKFYQEEQSGNYTGGHYGEHPNVLAHIRFNERPGPNGERVLFLEEIQSDWHQEGRKKGYAVEVPKYVDLPDGFFVEKSSDGNWYVYNRDGKWVAHAKTKQKALDSYSDERIAELKEEVTPPDAPFKTSWHELAMKRMISYAAKEGYDAIAWTKGETQFQRYGSSEIAWKKNAPLEVSVFELSPGLAKDAGGKYAISVERQGSPPDPYHKAYKTRSEAELAAAELKKGLLTKAKADPSWNVKATEQRGGEAGGIDIEGAARAEGILKEGGDRITTKQQLLELIEANVTSRERGQWSEANYDRHVDKLTDRVWERMQSEDAGTSLPRLEGMEGFYDKMLPRMKAWKKLGLKVETGELITEHRHSATGEIALPAHIVRLNPEAKAKVLDTGLARFMPDESLPGAERNQLGWAMLRGKNGKWRVYKPNGVLAGIGANKSRAETIFRTHYKRELRKRGKAAK